MTAKYNVDSERDAGEKKRTLEIKEISINYILVNNYVSILVH